MVDFRKFFPVLALVAVLLMGSAVASAQPVQCTAFAGNPIMRAEGLAELAGNVLISCPAGDLPGTVTFRIQLTNPQVTFTNRLVGGNPDAVLVVSDDPATAVQGTLTTPTIMDWTVTGILPEATTFTIRNLRVNASSFANQQVAQVNAFISTTNLNVNIQNANTVIGTVNRGLEFSVEETQSLLQCNDQNSGLDDGGTPATGVAVINFRELIPTAFKPLEPIPTQPVDFTESGFRFPDLGANIGLATTGTRLTATFTNVPQGVSLFVSRTNLVPVEGPVVARFVPGANANGVGGAFIEDGGYVEVTVGANRTATATWEIVDGFADVSENVQFGVALSFEPAFATGGVTPTLGAMSVAGNLAPVTTAVTSIPRFVVTATPEELITIVPCVTNLLFPFVAHGQGTQFDTGIAISNTTLDVFETPAQEGTCTINYFSDPNATTGAAPAAQTSTVISRGATLLFNLSGGNTNFGINATPNFIGYIIATCNFQYAHGLAFISDIGASNFAMGYLPLVMDNGETPARRGAPSEVLGF